MDEKDINISKSEEESLRIMENPSRITSEQLQSLKEDDACLQTCADLAKLAIEMQQKQNILGIDSRQELEKFRQKHSDNKRKRLRILWTSVAGVAATVIVILALRIATFTSEPESIVVFQADHTAQQVTLQVDGDKEVKPLKEIANTLSSSTVQMSAQKMDYHSALANSGVVGTSKIEIHKLSIPRGETFKVVLSDGTEVLLNSDSRLTYPSVFEGSERVVSLEGEAYFNVTKDANHPFIVKSGNMQVRVLGTEFNVSSYSPTDARVTLIEGKVAVSDTNGKHAVEIKPGQCAQLSSDGRFDVTEVDTESILYWREGLFYFDDVRLVDMMKEIGRWYNIDIEFQNPKIMDLRMRFFAKRDESILQLLESLNRMESIHATMEESKLIIR